MATKTGQDFTIWSGDNKNVTFTVTDSNSASVDLTGACVAWVLSNTPATASIVRLHSDSGCGITVSGCTFTVSLSPTHTSGLAGTYYHEAQVRDSASDISTVAVGTATIKFDVAGV